MIVNNHLNDYKIVELQEFAKTYELKNFRKLKKLELIEYILKSIRERGDEDKFKESKDLDDFIKTLAKASEAKEKDASDRYDSVQDSAKHEKKNIEAKQEDSTVEVSGILEILPDGFGFLRTENYSQSDNDYYVSPTYIKKFLLRQGDEITGKVRKNDQ